MPVNTGPSMSKQPAKVKPRAPGGFNVGALNPAQQRDYQALSRNTGGNFSNIGGQAGLMKRYGQMGGINPPGVGNLPRPAGPRGISPGGPTNLPPGGISPPGMPPPMQPPTPPGVFGGIGGPGQYGPNTGWTGGIDTGPSQMPNPMMGGGMGINPQTGMAEAGMFGGMNPMAQRLLQMKGRNTGIAGGGSPFGGMFGL